jgi:hypothetical protein
MAKAAELNGYVGPIHVLALSAQLGPTKRQQREVMAIFDRMSAASKPLGGELIGLVVTDMLHPMAEAPRQEQRRMARQGAVRA